MIHATAGSIRLIPEVKAAKASSRKNNAPKIAPPGNCPKASGKVSNIRPGPALGSRPCPDRVEAAEPKDVVVSMLSPDHCDVSGNRVISTFCNHIHFHASREVGDAWAAEKENDTFMLTLEEAFELGRLANAVRYGALLNE